MGAGAVRWTAANPRCGGNCARPRQGANVRVCRIEGTAIVRPSGHAGLVDGRIAWQGLRPAASAVCATPAVVGRLACRPEVCAALRPLATRWHASGTREARDRHVLRHGPATRSWPRRPKHGNNRLPDRVPRRQAAGSHLKGAPDHGKREVGPKVQSFSIGTVSIRGGVRVCPGRKRGSLGLPE